MSVRNQQQIEEIQNPITPVSQKSPTVLKSIRTITPETYKPDTVTSVTVESKTTVAVRSSEVGRKTHCSSENIVINFVNIFSL